MKLKICSLSKTYPDGTRALNKINLEIAEGVFGLLGPNGAGKTTLMRILATLLEPSEGSFVIEGLGINKKEKSAISWDTCRSNLASIRNSIV